MADGGGWNSARPEAAARYSRAMGAEICRRVADGESIRSLCDGPGLPHRTTLNHWRAAHPEFDTALDQAIRHARRDERMADRQAAAARAARPAPPRGGQPSTYVRALGEAICARLESGESLIAITADPGMPCYGRS